MKIATTWKKHKNTLRRFVVRYGNMVISAIIITLMSIFMAYNNTTYKKTLSNLEEKMNERFEHQTAFLVEAGQVIASSASADILAKIESSAETTERRMNRINAVYSGLLTEMEKRTIDSIYTENVLIDMEQEAASHFRAERYVQASSLYATIASSQPENKDAQFYYLYSLFLNNRMDRASYPRIKEGFLALERGGYTRREIREVISFIEEEEGAITEGAER